MNIWNILVSFISSSIPLGIPLLYGSTGEIVTEKSGHLNLGIPGIMYVGAISGVIGSFLYETADGNVHRLDAAIAEQPTDLSNYKEVNVSGCIKSMTFDSENPTVMLPAQTGSGANVHMGYGDYWMWRNQSERRYFLYGGAGDNGKVAGLFQYRAIVYSDKTAHSFYSARIMYRD